MVFEDIASILFRDILKVSVYPGAPFTGDMVYDLVSFFFVPMVFMILFIYIILGRIAAVVAWLRLLVGVALFLFMVVNGWYAAFALTAGPYFIFLIIMLGALYFIPSHFRRAEGAPATMPAAMPKTMGRSEAKRRLNYVKKRIKEIEVELSRIGNDPSTQYQKQVLEQELIKLKSEEFELEELLRLRLVS